MQFIKGSELIVDKTGNHIETDVKNKTSYLFNSNSLLENTLTNREKEKEKEKETVKINLKNKDLFGNEKISDEENEIDEYCIYFIIISR